MQRLRTCSSRSSGVRGRRAGLLSLAITALFLLFSRPSLADEEKTYMGASCHPDKEFIEGSIAGDAPFLSAKDGSIRNTDTQDHKVLCPIVKAVASSGNLQSVRVSVDLGTSAANSVSCQLRVFNSKLSSMSDPSHQLATVSPTMPVPSGPGIKVISFGNPATNTPAVAGMPAAWGNDIWSYYQLECTLPAQTAIRSYYVNEAGNRDPNKKTYPSSMCGLVERDSCGLLYNRGDGTWETHPDDGSFCGSPTMLSLMCPIIADNVANTQGIDLSVSAVLPFGGNVGSCTGYAVDHVGNILSSSEVRFDAIPNYQYPSLQKNMHLNGAAGAMYYMVCDMAGDGDGQFISYRVFENGAGEAVTADAKNYPGAMCYSTSYDGRTHAGELTPYVARHSSGFVFNGDFQLSNHVYCPIQGDHVGSSSGLASLNVYLFENALPEVTTCTVNSYTESGSAPSKSVSNTVPVSGNGTELTLPIPALPGNGQTNMRYELDCNLSRKSILRGYSVQEK